MKKKIDILVVALTLFTGTPCLAFVPTVMCGDSVMDNFTCSEVWGWAGSADGHSSWGTPADDMGRANSGLVSSASGRYAAGNEWIGISSYFVIDSKPFAATTLGKNRAESISTAKLVVDTYPDYTGIHKAKAIQPLLALLKQKGLTLHFLPPYSPELNRVEKLWHKMKYEWMAFKARSAATLEADVDKILAGFGSDYRMTFC